jgi:predicted dehydrogenase
MAKSKLRYVQVGLGSRSRMYTGALLGDFSKFSTLVGLCDINQGRLDLACEFIKSKGHKAPPTFLPGRFDEMIRTTKPDIVIVTTIDVTHSDYIIRAMELGCDVITEKPMTIDSDRCRAILDAAARTGRKLRVTFNYRYAPPRSQVKQVIQQGAIGDVLSVDFAWLLDTRHGADYFRRWHRRRENSGSLLVHKATHHFDLVNWWLDDWPQEVFAHGARAFYTPATADAMGLSGRAERCLVCGVRPKCRFALDLANSKGLKSMYLDQEHHDGYLRDRCVFSGDINIWDNMSLSVKYSRGTLLNYMLHACSSYEGYRIAFNGTKGRIEHAACENTYVSGDGTVPGELEKGKVTVTLVPAFGSPQSLEPWTGTGGHGGGDPVMLNDVFNPRPGPDPLKRRASQKDGAYSILVGVAAYTSIDQSRPVRIAELLGQSKLE